MLRFIVPAYNEEKNIELLVDKTRQYAQSRKYDYQLIVVNDGSTDRTVQILNDLKKTVPIVILDQVVNKGVGEAFKRGLSYAAEVADDKDIIVTKEADNTSDLSILDTMIQKINEGNDLVLASCYMPGGSVNGTNLYRKILSAGANFLLKMTTSLKGVHTFSSFYRAHRASLIKKAEAFYSGRLIEEKGFSCMVELLLKLSRMNINIAEVPMALRGEMRKGKSKMKTFKTIIGYIRLIVKNLPQNKRNMIGLAGFGLLGLLLRFVFIPFTLHQDMLWIHSFASKMAYHDVYDVYGYIKTYFYPSLFSHGINYYPPLAYYLLGGFYFIAKLIAPGIGNWLDMYSAVLASGDYSNYLELFRIPFASMCSYISIMKAPYLVFDALCVTVLWQYFNNAKDRIRAFKFWMINPVIIFGSYIFGQFDIAIALFLLSALYMIDRGRPYAGMFIIGLSCLLKSTPILLILPLALLLGRGVNSIGRLLLAAAAPIVIAMTPFYLSTGSYSLTALFPTFIGGAGASPADTIEFAIGKIIFVAGYIFMIFKILSDRKEPSSMGPEAWKYMLSIMLLSYFIVFTPIHYFQWTIPLLIIGVINNKVPRSIYIFQIVCLFVYALGSRQVGGQLFLPLNPDYFYNIKSIPEYMNQFMKWGLVMKLASVLFYTCSIYVICKILKPEVKSA